MGSVSTGYIIHTDSGEPLYSHIIGFRWPESIHMQKVIPFYLNDLVLQLSHTAYQAEGMCLYMYSELSSTLRTLPCRARVA